MSRAQLKHVLLDVTFKDKPKIIDLEIEHKPIARLLVMDILAACSAATNAEITRNVCIYLGNRIGIEAESVENILNYCIDNDILWAVNGKITNPRVIKDQESYYRKLESDRKRKESKRIPTGKNTDSDIDFDIDIDINNKENSQPKIGLIKLSEHVRISEINKPLFELRLQSEGLDEKAKQEIIELLDRDFHKHPEKRRETCHFRDLISWPLREIRADRSRLSKKDPFKPPEKTIREIREEAKLKQQIKELGT